MMCSKHRQLLEANATDTDPVETGAGTVGVEQCFVTVGSSFCHRFSWEQYDNTDCTVSVLEPSLGICAVCSQALIQILLRNCLILDNYKVYFN